MKIKRKDLDENEQQLLTLRGSRLRDQNKVDQLDKLLQDGNYDILAAELDPTKSSEDNGNIFLEVDKIELAIVPEFLKNNLEVKVLKDGFNRSTVFCAKCKNTVVEEFYHVK